MRDLPGGTVTFLFTDIEGSTRLLHELGADRYAEALAEHRRVLRDAFERHGGVEVDTQGDAFFVAFSTAPGALEAAREAQAGLELPVRMGLHTGTPLLTDEGYVGADVHRAARVAAAGHGRQVLVSAATAALVDAAELRDLGEHRLKDLSAPERIFQLGSEDFAPLKTLYRTNLPIPATPFLGRDQELAEVGNLLARTETRLLVLTGAGGSGKTRLALQTAGAAADSYPDGVWWIALAPLSNAADVVPLAAQVLGGGGTVVELVGDRRLLLVFDNFEHVMDAAPALADVLASCPNVDLLVTSRERLRIGGEQVYPVPVMAREDSREFFVARARAAQPDYEPDELVDELCARLDDLPLALELAAARVSLLSTAQLLERLGNRLDTLRGGRDAELRQQTLRATIEWSFELLDPAEQRLLAALSVFRGGWTLEAAEQVADADVELLQSLVDKSLVRRWDSGRFGMLETIREFSLEHADDVTRRRHAEHFLELGESANLSAEGRGPDRPELVRPELDNLRAAIDWAVEHDLELAFRLAISLEQLWVITDAFEGVRRFAALFAAGGSVPPVLRGRGLRCYAEAAWIAGDFERAQSLMADAYAEFERLGDEAALAVILVRLGVSEMNTNNVASARRQLEQSQDICRRYPNPKLEADLVQKLAWVAEVEGDLVTALELYEESAARCEDAGIPWLRTSSLRAAATIAHELGRAAAAEGFGREALRVAVALVDRQSIVFGLATLARVAAGAERAGLFWGVIEAEEERGPIGHWYRSRDAFEAAVVRADAEFERGRAAGRRLSLDEAVELALSIDSPA